MSYINKYLEVIIHRAEKKFNVGLKAQPFPIQALIYHQITYFQALMNALTKKTSQFGVKFKV